MGVQSLGQEDPLEEEMATHSNILAWRIPWIEEPGRLQFMQSQSWTQLSIRALTATLNSFKMRNCSNKSVLDDDCVSRGI